MKFFDEFQAEDFASALLHIYGDGRKPRPESRFLSDADYAQLPPLGTTEGQVDAIAWLRLLDEYTGHEWLVVEFDGIDVCFGLKESQDMGYFSLQSLELVWGLGGRSSSDLHHFPDVSPFIERDPGFSPTPLSRILGRSWRLHLPRKGTPLDCWVSRLEHRAWMKRSRLQGQIPACGPLEQLACERCGKTWPLTQAIRFDPPIRENGIIRSCPASSCDHVERTHQFQKRLELIRTAGIIYGSDVDLMSIALEVFDLA